ncbi:membrane protein DedA with SNARE-associated domain/membrane-associated phospholipid phosphatase [Paraburkholderia sp. 40]
MEHAYIHLLHMLAGHSTWMLAVVFLAAFFEAIAVIGTFVPGSTAMFVAGALTGTGSLSLAWVFVWAIVGAVAGDGASFWLGDRYRERIVTLWPFRAHPGVLDAGQRFFLKHGAKSVVLARFIGPLRAIVPVVAGMMGMRPLRFLSINVLSALLWAPAHILPGVVFGASVLLAGAVSFRLVVIIAMLACIVWLSFRGAGFLVSHANAWSSAAGRHLGSWACRHPGPLGRIARRMLDPDTPDATHLLATSLIVLVAGALFFGVLDDVVSGDPLTTIDLSVYHFLQSIRTPWGDTVLAALATLGSGITLFALVVTVALWMVWERRWRTIGYWLAAVVFSQLLILGLQLAMRRAPPNELMSGHFVFPSNHVAATVIVYGFLAFLLARRIGKLGGVLVAAASIIVVIVVALAGVYFGHYWVSDAIGGAALACVWVALVALTAIWRHPRPPPPRRFMPLVVLAVVALSVGLQLGVAMPTPPGQRAATTPRAVHADAVEALRVEAAAVLSLRHGRRSKGAADAAMGLRARFDTRAVARAGLGRGHRRVRAQPAVACFARRRGGVAAGAAEAEQWRAVVAGLHATGQFARGTLRASFLAERLRGRQRHLRGAALGRRIRARAADAAVLAAEHSAHRSRREPVRRAQQVGRRARRDGSRGGRLSRRAGVAAGLAEAMSCTSRHIQATSGISGIPNSTIR